MSPSNLPRHAKVSKPRVTARTLVAISLAGTLLAGSTVTLFAAAGADYPPGTSGWLVRFRDLAQVTAQPSPTPSATPSPSAVPLGGQPGGWAGAAERTQSIAWGDVDDDGDLDLAAGNANKPNRVYRNRNGRLDLAAAWTAAITETTRSVAWGDMDGDGDLDLAVGNEGSPNRVYRNQDGQLDLEAAWTAAISETTRSIAWGDVNGDGYADLAVGNWGSPSRIYLNQGRDQEGNGLGLNRQPAWSSPVSARTYAVAWGDMDGDSDLDLAVGNGCPHECYPIAGDANEVYRNDGLNAESIPLLSAAWFPLDADATTSVAWGDVDGDGDLDLAAGNWGSANKVYLNRGKPLGLAPAADWESNVTDWTGSIDWGDVDGDGDLDLAAANTWESTKVYVNRGETLGLDPDPAWASSDASVAFSIAWVDVDGDGDLDLAVGSEDSPIKVYPNRDARLGHRAGWLSSEAARTFSVAWADFDRDGDLDLAAGGASGRNKVYVNEQGHLEAEPAWTATISETTRSIAWGDVNGDGYVDLAVGNWEGPTRLYLNQGGRLGLASEPAWSAPVSETTRAVAWADVDGDGDLDLAVGNYGSPNKVYANAGAMLAAPMWVSAERDDTKSIAWGDVDGDGDLDLAVGNVGKDRIYANQAGRLEEHARWSSDDADDTQSVAWGDVDGDGDLDLATGNVDGPLKLYANQDGHLNPVAEWSSNYADSTESVAWADADGDGDLDLAAGNLDRSRLYLNEDGRLSPDAAWSSTPEGGDTVSIAWGDVDGDGDLDLAAGNTPDASGMGGQIGVYLNGAPIHPPRARGSLHTALNPTLAPAAFFARSDVLEDIEIPITYRLSHPDGRGYRRVGVFYSPDGGGKWITATETAGVTSATDIASGIEHVFRWNTFDSGFFGHSDAVVIRLVAYPELRTPMGGVPGPFQRPYIAAQSYPFRVRATQVRVVTGTTTITGVPGANVYRLPAGQTHGGEALVSPGGAVFRTDPGGYLQGRGEVRRDDQLVALAPVTVTLPVSVSRGYSLFLTSAAPTETGLDMDKVENPGVQTLTVSPGNRLVLFNLSLSLEWDARNDPVFLERLAFDLQRASEALFDWTNGQAALGELTVYHDRDHWNEADIRVYASNRVRPVAIQGGIVDVGATQADPDNPHLSQPIFYRSGQVHMGVTWNRFGDASGNLAEDWSRTLVHELGHYLFFLDDNYLGFDDKTGLLAFVDSCADTAMTDPYRYTEFHHGNRTTWEGQCGATLAEHATGRWDWQTIQLFWPWLTGANRNPGPSGLPIAVTRVTHASPAPGSDRDPLAVPLFDVAAETGRLAGSGAGARAFLFGQERVTALGSPVLDRVNARGARTGERLCVMDLAVEPPRVGCKIVGEEDAENFEIVLHGVADWRPDVTLGTTTSGAAGAITDSLAITVTGRLPADAVLRARVYPDDGPATKEITLTAAADGRTYLGAFSLADLAGGRRSLPPEGMAHVWVAGDDSSHQRQIVADYGLGGNPGRLWGSTGRLWGSTGRLWGSTAPAMSPDGKVVVYARDLKLKEGDFFALQGVTVVPDPPGWATVVGDVYRLYASGDLLSRAESPVSISFNYVGTDVPAGEERAEWLRIAFYEEARRSWQVLEPTTVDTYYNLASTRATRPGIYALIATIELPLHGPGWNLFSYPVFGSRPVHDALIAVDEAYDLVWGHVYDTGLRRNLWQVYGPALPGWLNSLHRLEFARSYWVHLTRAVDAIRLKGSTSTGTKQEPGAAGQRFESVPLGDDPLPNPPALYYGAILNGPGFAPAADMAVTARIDGRVCGKATTRLEGGEIVYGIQVVDERDDQPGAVGCGAPGRTVTFQVGGRDMVPQVAWSTQAAWQVPLAQITSRPDTGRVAGTVRLQGRGAHPGVTVQVSGFTTTTDATGYFELTVPSGTHDVTATRSRYLPGTRRGVRLAVGQMVVLPDGQLRGGDTDGNERVDLFDLVRVGAAYNTSPPTDPLADVNEDGTVNLVDLVLVGSNYGSGGDQGWSGTRPARALTRAEDRLGTPLSFVRDSLPLGLLLAPAGARN